LKHVESRYFRGATNARHENKEQFTEEVRGEEGGWIWRNSGKENKRGKWAREKEGIKQKKANSKKIKVKKKKRGMRGGVWGFLFRFGKHEESNIDGHNNQKQCSQKRALQPSNNPTQTQKKEGKQQKVK